MAGVFDGVSKGFDDLVNKLPCASSRKPPAGENKPEGDAKAPATDKPADQQGNGLMGMGSWMNGIEMPKMPNMFGGDAPKEEAAAAAAPASTPAAAAAAPAPAPLNGVPMPKGGLPGRPPSDKGSTKPMSLDEVREGMGGSRRSAPSAATPASPPSDSGERRRRRKTSSSGAGAAAAGAAAAGAVGGAALAVAASSAYGNGRPSSRPAAADQQAYEYYEYGSYYSTAGSARGSKPKGVPHAGGTEYEYVYYEDDKYGAGPPPNAAPGPPPAARQSHNMGEDPMLLSSRLTF